MDNSALVYQEEFGSGKNVTLFQFWDSDIPDEVAKLTQGVAAINSAVDYRLFDDISAAGFIREEFGADVLKLYDSCVIPAMRADLFRYCYLVKCGGFYIDADFPAVASIEPVIETDWQGCLYMRAKGLANGMMFFREAGHPLAEKILQKALDNMTRRTSNNVWEVTGPHVLREVYADQNNSGLFDGIHLMGEEEFIGYFKPSPNLGYKHDDSHWLIARQKGLKIFKD
ncbi:MAG: glycosyltransferase family 32 protein [Granulosicoccus sp.]